MKKFFLLVFCTTFTLVSCQNDETEVNGISNEMTEPQIEISLPAAETIQSRANTVNPVTEWENGDKIGLYAVDQGTLTTYRGAQPNLCYKFSKSERKWDFDATADTKKPKQLFLHSGNAVLYAFSPWDKVAEDLTATPVKFNTNVDYLYGTHRVAPLYVNNQQTSIKLEMLHAQTYVAVRLKRSVDHPYNEDGVVTSLKITGNTPANQAAAYVKGSYPATGTLNLTKGAINTTGATRGDIVVSGFSSGITIPALSGATAPATSIFYAMIAPEAASVRKGFQLVVDGKTHFVPISECEWKAGYKYIYTLTITGKGIEGGDEVDPNNPNDHSGDALVIRPWANGVNEDYDF